RMVTPRLCGGLNMPRHVSGWLFVCGLLAVGSATGDESSAQRFSAVDADGDRRVSREEFLKLPGGQQVLARDCTLFALAAKSSLSPDEFAAVPLGRPPRDRGPLPDPFAEIARQAMADIDKTCGQWDEHPTQQFGVLDFVQRFLSTFPDPDRVVS